MQSLSDPSPDRPSRWLVDAAKPPTARAALSSAPPPRRRRPIAVLVVVLLVAAVGAGAYLLGEDDKPELSAAGSRPDVPALAGIPQTAGLLGPDRPSVPELTVFADLSSPEFRRFSENVLPGLLSDYVRPGRLAIQLRTLPGRSATGDLAARTAQAAGLQTRLWQYAGALAGRGGTIDAADVTAAARAVPGLDAERVKKDRRSARIARAIARARRIASADGVRSTPAFRVTYRLHARTLSAPLSRRPFLRGLARALERLHVEPSRSDH